MNFLDDRLPLRFWEKVQPCPMSGCWIWTGTEINCGYGRTNVSGRRVLAHRVTATIHYGPIPEKMKVDHLCRVRLCVNPLHLEIVTQRENVLRGVSVMSARAAQTHCKRGHVLAGDNLKVHKRGGGIMRTCVACDRAWRSAR